VNTADKTHTDASLVNHDSDCKCYLLLLNNKLATFIILHYFESHLNKNLFYDQRS